MSMIKELKIVRETLFSMIVEGKSNTFEAQEAYAKLTAIIEQMEKAEPVVELFVGTSGTITGTGGKVNLSLGWNKLFAHPAPTPDEITKLREQLAAVTRERE